MPSATVLLRLLSMAILRRRLDRPYAASQAATKGPIAAPLWAPVRRPSSAYSIIKAIHGLSCGRSWLTTINGTGTATGRSAVMRKPAAAAKISPIELMMLPLSGTTVAIA